MFIFYSLQQAEAESTSKMAEILSLGILIDIVDEDWMRDTLPDDGNNPYFSLFQLILVIVFFLLYF